MLLKPFRIENRNLPWPSLGDDTLGDDAPFFMGGCQGIGSFLVYQPAGHGFRCYHST
jgi:hypothetical protein